MKIIGTGSALPKKVVTNDMLAGFLDTATSGSTLAPESRQDT